MLASLLYPYDSDAAKRIDGWLDELQRERCVARYAVNGDQYIEICHFRVHQRIDKPSASKLPPRPPDPVDSENPREDSENIREESCKLAEKISRKGREGNGKEGIGNAPDGAPARATLTEPTDEHRALAKSLGLDCRLEWDSFEDHAKAKSRHFADKGAAFRNWLRQEKKFAVRDGRVRAGPASMDVGEVV